MEFLALNHACFGDTTVAFSDVIFVIREGLRKKSDRTFSERAIVLQPRGC
jgi:hypothetical protein